MALLLSLVIQSEKNNFFGFFFPLCAMPDPAQKNPSIIKKCCHNRPDAVVD
jgi:hypothetical protein